MKRSTLPLISRLREVVILNEWDSEQPNPALKRDFAKATLLLHPLAPRYADFRDQRGFHSTQ